MNLNEIQDILKNKLQTPEKMTKTILAILRIVKYQSYRARQEIIDIIERDSAE